MTLWFAAFLVGNLNRANQLLALQSERIGVALANIEQKRLVGEDVSQQILLLTVELNTTTNQQATGSHQQATGLAQVVNSLQQMAQTAQQVMAKTDYLHKVAETVKAFVQQTRSATTIVTKAGEQGVVAVESTIDSNQRACLQYEKLHQHLQELHQRQNQLKKIILTIESISDEINLLSLNASIEAAGAGSYGERFNIIAGEVKALATRSLLASRDVNETLSAIEEGIQLAATSAESSYQELQITLSVAQESGLAINELLVNIRRNAEEVNKVEEIVALLNQQTIEIIAATTQQYNASDQAVLALQHGTTIAFRVAEGCQETARNVTNLETLSQHLLAALR
jgi:methyl-accepting chemotaxis protein